MDTIQPHTDQQLIQLIQGENRQAFRQLFDRHYQVLWGTAINLLKDKDLAKDAVQEVFLQIWKNREKITITSSVPAYLKRAVINRCLNRIRSRKSFVGAEQLEHRFSPETSAQEQLEVNDVHKALQKSLNTLPERCRTIFVMKRLEGMSQKEIAAELGISPKTVENQITKALKVLKEDLLPFVKKRSGK